MTSQKTKNTSKKTKKTAVGGKTKVEPLYSFAVAMIFLLKKKGAVTRMAWLDDIKAEYGPEAATYTTFNGRDIISHMYYGPKLWCIHVNKDDDEYLQLRASDLTAKDWLIIPLE